MHFRNISFDMILYTLTEIFHSDRRQIRLFYCFHAVSFLHILPLPVPVPELGINNSKPRSKFNSPLILLMIVYNRGNKLFICKSISSRGSTAKQSQTQGTSLPLISFDEIRSKTIYDIKLVDEVDSLCFTDFN